MDAGLDFESMEWFVRAMRDGSAGRGCRWNCRTPGEDRAWCVMSLSEMNGSQVIVSLVGRFGVPGH